MNSSGEVSKDVSGIGPREGKSGYMASFYSLYEGPGCVKNFNPLKPWLHSKGAGLHRGCPARGQSWMVIRLNISCVGGNALTGRLGSSKSSAQQLVRTAYFPHEKKNEM